MGGHRNTPRYFQFLFVMAKVKPLLRFVNKQTENTSTRRLGNRRLNGTETSWICFSPSLCRHGIESVPKYECLLNGWQSKRMTTSSSNHGENNNVEMCFRDGSGSLHWRITLPPTCHVDLGIRFLGFKFFIFRLEAEDLQVYFQIIR